MAAVDPARLTHALHWATGSDRRQAAEVRPLLPTDALGDSGLYRFVKGVLMLVVSV